MSLKTQTRSYHLRAETPITLDQIVQLVRDSLLADEPAMTPTCWSRVRAALDELTADYGAPDHGVEIRQVAVGIACPPSPSSTM